MPHRGHRSSRSLAHQESVRRYIAPAGPEHRVERTSAPYAGPSTPEEWRDAFRAMAAADPDDVRDMLGARFG